MMHSDNDGWPDIKPPDRWLVATVIFFILVALSL